MIVTVANAKGGVAKTTTAVYLCAAHGLAVDDPGDALLLDADVQASASLWRDMADEHGGLGFDVVAANLSTLRRLRGSTAARDHGLAVVDAPPQGPVLEAAVRTADFVVVPRRTVLWICNRRGRRWPRSRRACPRRSWSCGPSRGPPRAWTPSSRWTRRARPGSTRSCSNARTSSDAWARARRSCTSTRACTGS